MRSLTLRCRRRVRAARSCRRPAPPRHRRSCARSCDDTQTARAHVHADGRPTRAARVTQARRRRSLLARPGKFRWTYEKPYEQLIVGDGAARVDLRRGSEPGHRAQARRRARRDARRAACRRPGRRARFTLARICRRRTGSSGVDATPMTPGDARSPRSASASTRKGLPRAMELDRRVRPEDASCASPRSSAIRSSRRTLFRFDAAARARTSSATSSVNSSVARARCRV